MNKYRLKEILIIVFAASILGIVYNYSLPKPLPLIYTKKIVPKISDEKLFGNEKTDSAGVDEQTVTYEQMLKIINDKEFIIVDARNPDYFKKSRIGNPINIFPYADESEIIGKILDLPLDKKIVVYCDGGNCDSSHKIAEMMKNFGYNNVHIYTGGWEEWTKKQGIKQD